MKKILITGADGFIGSHLTEHLVENGYDVTAFVYYNSFNSYGWIDSLPAQTRSALNVVAGDIRDQYFVKQAMKGKDVVYHLAALIGIPYSYHAPENYADTNIKGTLNVLQAARDTAPEKVLITSTSEVYGTAVYTPIDEKHPKQPQSPYSATKIAADAIAESFYRSFNLPVTIVRPFNTYGPRQSARAVIPTIISQLLNGVTNIKLGSLHPTRDLLFVKDTVSAFLAIANTTGTNGEEINIATQQEINIKALAEKIINIINPAASIISDDIRIRPENSEVERLLGSNEKIKKLTGWQPRTNIDEGLRETIAWFSDRSNLEKYRHGEYNV